MGMYFFFFQAEDGIRDLIVTGVQTCALPIYAPLQLAREAGNASRFLADELASEDQMADQLPFVGVLEPGLGRELPRLAEVVEQGSGGDQVAVELGIVIADPPAKLHHRQRVLAEAAGMCVVDALRGGGAQGGPRERGVVEEPEQEPADISAAPPGRQPADHPGDRLP